jgi:hypothetical protein
LLPGLRGLRGLLASLGGLLLIGGDELSLLTGHAGEGGSFLDDLVAGRLRGGLDLGGEDLALVLVGLKGALASLQRGHGLLVTLDDLLLVAHRSISQPGTDAGRPGPALQDRDGGGVASLVLEGRHRALPDAEARAGHLLLGGRDLDLYRGDALLDTAGIDLLEVVLLSEGVDPVALGLDLCLELRCLRLVRLDSRVARGGPPGWTWIGTRHGHRYEKPAQ